MCTSLSTQLSYPPCQLHQIINKTEVKFKQQLEGCSVLNKHNITRSGPLYAIGEVFPWAHQSRRSNTKDILIASAVFAGLTEWQTDWQTDRPRYSAGNNRWSAQWKSRILLLSTATINQKGDITYQHIAIESMCW